MAKTEYPYVPYELKGRAITTLKDLADLISEVFNLVNDAYGGSPIESGTIWTDMRYGMLRALEATEELDEDELSKPYDYRFDEVDVENGGDYSFFKRHPGYVSSPYTKGC